MRLRLAIALDLESKSRVLNNQWTVGPGVMTSRMQTLHSQTLSQLCFDLHGWWKWLG